MSSVPPAHHLHAEFRSSCHSDGAAPGGHPQHPQAATQRRVRGHRRQHRHDPDAGRRHADRPHISRDPARSDLTSRETERDVDDVRSWAWISDNVLVNSSGDSRRVCRPNPKYSWKSSFITEIVYGLSITVVPFVPIVAVSPATMTSKRVAVTSLCGFPVSFLVLW